MLSHLLEWVLRRSMILSKSIVTVCLSVCAGIIMDGENGGGIRLLVCHLIMCRLISQVIAS
jgi:hypothetical protein